MPSVEPLVCRTEIDYSAVTVHDRVLPFIIRLDLELSDLCPAAGNNQRFCYRIIGIGEDQPAFVDLSHWVLSLCEEIRSQGIVNITVTINGTNQDIAFGEDGNVTLFRPPAADPPTGCPGLKFDFALDRIKDAEGSLGLFCFELTTSYPVGDVEVCLFGGGRTARGLSICGPVCVNGIRQRGISIADVSAVEGLTLG